MLVDTMLRAQTLERARLACRNALPGRAVAIEPGDRLVVGEVASVDTCLGRSRLIAEGVRLICQARSVIGIADLLHAVP